MANKYLAILVSALNPSNKLITSFGDLRTRQYISGFERIYELAQAFLQFDFVIVDNTISPEWKMPEELDRTISKIPNTREIFFCDNELAEKNKGCGVLLDLKKVFAEIDMSQYEYCLYFEPRQFLLNFGFFTRFIAEPGNYFHIAKYRVTAKTKAKRLRLLLKFIPLYKRQFMVGLFAIQTQALGHYLSGVNLAEIAEKQISIEDDMYEKLKHLKFKNVKNLGLLWHNAFENIYIPY